MAPIYRNTAVQTDRFRFVPTAVGMLRAASPTPGATAHGPADDRAAARAASVRKDAR